MKKLSEITCLVVDNGLFCELARVLGKTFKKVYYCSPWRSPFPRMNDAYIGYGMDEIELIDEPEEVYGEIDLAVFPDVYYGEQQKYLRSIGIPVWGSGLGERLELDRDSTKKIMQKRGLPVGKYVVLKGMEALREHLKHHKDQFVKIDKYRGHFETFHARDYKDIEPRLDEMEMSFGPFKHIVEFTVEDALPDCVEVGIDGYCIDGEYPDKILWGVEVKDLAYLGSVGEYAKLPKELTTWGETMSYIMKKAQYRGSFSNEFRIGADRKSYMIDACCRMASPPGELYQELYENLAEIVWMGAQGVCINPKVKAKYGAEVIIHSQWANTHFQPVDFPEEYRDNIKLRNCVKIKGCWYVVPRTGMELPEIGSIIGYGNTIQAACDMVKEIGKEVKNYGLDIPYSSIDDAIVEYTDTIDTIGGKK